MKHVVGAPDRTRTCNRRLRRPMLYPVELQAQSPRGRAQRGRGRGIRTPDFCVPNATLYQTELYPARDTDHYRYAKLSNATGDVPSSQSVFEHARLESAWPAVRCFAPRSGERRKRRTLRPEVGAPGEIRTPDRLVRSQVLYPAELRARTSRLLAGRSSLLLEPPNQEAELFRYDTRASTLFWIFFALSCRATGTPGSSRSFGRPNAQTPRTFAASAVQSGLSVYRSALHRRVAELGRAGVPARRKRRHRARRST